MTADPNRRPTATPPTEFDIDELVLPRRGNPFTQ